MKKNIFEFIHRGLIACGFGPLVLAVVYLVLHQNGEVESLTVNSVCIGILSLTALAFIAGGMNVIYKIERMPLMMAILIHAGVLYIGYLATYLVNGWLKSGVTPILVFTCIFVLGYLAIWAIIYSVTKSKTKKLNKMLEKNQQNK